MITTIDHSKAMLRVRKNIDKGYRDLGKFRDRKCIDQFIRTSLLGTYRKTHSLRKKMKCLDRMKDLYLNYPSIRVEGIANRLEE